MIDFQSRRAANDAPDTPHSAGDRRLIATLTHQRDEAQRETAIFRRRCVEQARQLGELLGKRALHPISAATIWSEIVARADEEGAMHRDDVLAILRKHGAV